MTKKEQAILWLDSFVKNKEPMILVPKPLIRLMYDVLTQKPITNYDRIINKTPEELAVICEDGCPPKHECPTMDTLGEIVEKSACQQCWLDWLQQEVGR